MTQTLSPFLQSNENYDAASEIFGNLHVHLQFHVKNKYAYFIISYGGHRLLGLGSPL